MSMLSQVKSNHYGYHDLPCAYSKVYVLYSNDLIPSKDSSEDHNYAHTVDESDQKNSNDIMNR